jgi:hypothetical protein
VEGGAYRTITDKRIYIKAIIFVQKHDKKERGDIKT